MATIDSSLFVARNVKRKRVDYEGVRKSIAQIKQMLREETDYNIKKQLAEAGLRLNSLLLK
jgi:hypothetical protein